MMEWFKHDSGATQDAKIKKLLIKHGAVGYAVYFHCLELITSDISANNITFQLEHDSEIIADNLRIRGTAEKSGIDIVEEIMRTILDLDLFQVSNNRIYCLKMVKRLDSSMTSNTKMRQLISASKEYHDTVMIPSCKKRTEENRKEEKRDKHTLPNGQSIPINLITHQSLVDEYGIDVIEGYYERISDWSASTNKKYADYSATCRNWIKDDIKKGKGPTKKHVAKRCPSCDAIWTNSGCQTCFLTPEEINDKDAIARRQADHKERTTW